MKGSVTFWKFVPHPVDTTREQAAALARRIEAGEVTARNENGDRFYRVGGWCFDIGRKPFLIESADGQFSRRWALSVGELRRACYLRRGDRVVADPFHRRGFLQDTKAA